MPVQLLLVHVHSRDQKTLATFLAPSRTRAGLRVGHSTRDGSGPAASSRIGDGVPAESRVRAETRIQSISCGPRPGSSLSLVQRLGPCQSSQQSSKPRPRSGPHSIQVWPAFSSGAARIQARIQFRCGPHSGPHSVQVRPAFRPAFSSGVARIQACIQFRRGPHSGPHSVPVWQADLLRLGRQPLGGFRP